MPSYSKKISLFLLAVFVLTAVFFSGFAQASFWNMIRAWVTINPLEVGVSAPEEVEINKVFKVEAKLINKGEEKIENARGEIFLPSKLTLLNSKLTLLKKDPVQRIGVIPGKKEKKVSWSVKGEELGYYFISVKASGEIEGEELSKESITIKVKIKEKAAPGERTHFNFFQNLFDFFQKWLGY